MFQNEKYGIKSNPISTWLKWEQTPSIPSFKLTVKESKVLSQHVDANQINLTLSPDAPVDLKNILLSEDGKIINWYSHPYNTNESVPYFELSKNAEGPTLQAEHNASRTVTVEVNGNLYGLKLPTNRPFGPGGEIQESKSDMKEDVLLARKRSEVVEKVDKILGQDPELTILRYVAVVEDKESGNGFVFRDLRPMQDGNYYLPAHQIPSIGKEIAQKNNADFVQFWGKHWAEKLGSIQAKTLIRYGIESEATNPQNYLIQLDRNFKPTGKIFYRDITDSNFNGPIARAIGFNDYVVFDEKHSIPVSTELVGWKRNYSLTWHFDSNASGFDTQNITPKWRQQHIQSYVRTIVKLLSLDSKVDWTYGKLSDSLNTEEGLKAVKKFHKLDGIGRVNLKHDKFFSEVA